MDKRQVYDLLVDFGARCRLEGINLKVPRSDYVEEQPLSADDIKVINTKVRRLNKFEDEVQILTIQGNIQHAAILITKLRTRPFFGSKPGELIWRAELWHFERPEETWLKRTDELFTVLYRQRMQKSRYVQKAVTFDGSLGGISVRRRPLGLSWVGSRHRRPGPACDCVGRALLWTRIRAKKSGERRPPECSGEMSSVGGPGSLRRGRGHEEVDES